MRNLTLPILFCLIIIAIPTTLKAQKWNDGRFSGSLESNSIYYVPDKDVFGNVTPDDRIGSNNYMKLEYTNGRLTIGAQYEYYGKALQGYSPTLKDGKIMNKFVTWSDKGYSITVGDMYEQFGNGLILRTWEDRDLGFNNSLEGVRVTFNHEDYFKLTGLWGRPRFGMKYMDTQVRGADASVSLSRLMNFSRHYLAIEGSFVNRYENRRQWYENESSLSNNMDSWSGRFVFESDFGFYFKGEAAGKGRDAFMTGFKRGNAQLVEIGYTGSGFGISLTGRRMEYMMNKITYDPEYLLYGENNMLNYLPALTKQHTYMLANLQPHKLMNDGEQGGQLDVFYNARKGTAIGGQYGTKFHLNASAYLPVEKNIKGDRELLYTDISFDIDKKWNRTFETTFLYSFQGYNPTGDITANELTSKLLKSHIFVLDMLYKFNRKTSIRVELQYLYSEDNYLDWANDWWGALVELNVAPSWSFFVSDMYNWGNDNKWTKPDGSREHLKQHYYNGGFSYTKGRIRAALSYGRNRAGMMCSGGVCRQVPAYTGANFTLSASF